MWQLAVGCLGAAIVTAIALWKRRRHVKYDPDAYFSPQRVNRERIDAELEPADRTSAEYKVRVKERMLRGYESQHPPLYVSTRKAKKS